MEPNQRNEPAEGSAEKEIVVVISNRDGQCADCGRDYHQNSFLQMEERMMFCLECADLDHLEYLPRGNAALSRRAGKYSELRAVVVEWSKSRKRFERQGILASPEGIRRAEEECLADAEVRELRQRREAVRREAADREYVSAVVEQLGEMIPGCPREEREAIAAHACAKYSGRVGRSAAARDFDPAAFRLAVIAHIRHCHTNYDRLLDRGRDRRAARAAVQMKIADILSRWEKGIRIPASTERRGQASA